MILCGCESSDNQKGVEKPESSTSISNNANEETEQTTTEKMTMCDYGTKQATNK